MDRCPSGLIFRRALPILHRVETPKYQSINLLRSRARFPAQAINATRNRGRYASRKGRSSVTVLAYSKTAAVQNIYLFRSLMIPLNCQCINAFPVGYAVKVQEKCQFHRKCWESQFSKILIYLYKSWPYHTQYILRSKRDSS